MTDKEKIECLSDLCRFLAGIQEEQRVSIFKAVSHKNDTRDKVINQLVMKTPMVQGMENQIRLATIGNQKAIQDNIDKAVNYLLGNN